MNYGAQKKGYRQREQHKGDPVLEAIDRWKKRVIAFFVFASLLLALGRAFTVEVQHTFPPEESVRAMSPPANEHTTYHYHLVLRSVDSQRDQFAAGCRAQERTPAATGDTVTLLLAEEADPHDVTGILTWLDARDDPAVAVIGKLSHLRLLGCSSVDVSAEVRPVSWSNHSCCLLQLRSFLAERGSCGD